MDFYDVIVIGSGQGGNPFALECACRGMRTALIESGPIGGTCLNTGCTPTKTMIASGRVAYLANRGSEFGVKTGPIEVDMPVIRERKRAIVADFTDATEKHDITTPNLTLIRETARFTGPKRLEAGPFDLTADIVVIDTGGRPFIPPVPGLGSARYYDNAGIMELDQVPEHLLVLGGGYIGVEFSQLFKRLGSRVTIIERSPNFLGREDRDIAQALASIFAEDGIEILLGSEAKSVSSSSDSVSIEIDQLGKGMILTGSHLLVALGRTPNVESLNLEASGVMLTPKGAIQVNERLETSSPGVFAIGDVNGGPQFTHISYDDFRLLRDNLLDGGSRSTEDRMVPYVVFTDPQLGRVGLTEDQAIARGVKCGVFTMPMTAVARALETAESRGMMKAIVDSDSKLILGAAVLGVEGGEVLNMIQIAMMGKLPYPSLQNGVFAHPTLGECLNNLFLPSASR